MKYMINGSINQISIPVSDYMKAKEFFEATFGWDVDIETYPSYAIVKWENDMSLGFYKSENIEPKGPMIVFSVRDIDLTIKNLVNSGGTILQEKHSMSDGEFGVVFKDIFGNRFRLKGK